MAFSFAGARLPTLALGRLAKSFAGWCLDIFLLVGAMMRFQLGMGNSTRWRSVVEYNDHTSVIICLLNERNEEEWQDTWLLIKDLWRFFLLFWLLMLDVR